MTMQSMTTTSPGNAMFEFWGCSDDCIEVSGSFEEEVYGENTELFTSDGLRAAIRYDGDGEGNWIVSVLESPSHVPWTLHPAGSPAAIEITGRDYTDVLVVEGEPDWVGLGKQVYHR